MGRALRVPIWLAMVGLALSGPRLLHAQTRRDSFVNPGQSGPQGIVGGPPGPSVGRTQPRFGVLPSIDFGVSDPGKMIVSPSRTPQDIPQPVPREHPDRQKPLPEPMIGPTGGLTLDEAIETLLHNSLDLQQSRGDISQAEADLITAGLRANPIAYVDTLGVPYGSYTSKTSGGPMQSDFNIVHPLDLSHKRQARMKSAWLNRRAVEEKYKDIVRLAIDNVCTSFIDALLAQRNVKFKRDNELKAVKDVLATIEYEDAKEIYEDAVRTLSLQLNLPLEVLMNRRLRGRIRVRPRRRTRSARRGRPGGAGAPQSARPDRAAGYCRAIRCRYRGGSGQSVRRCPAPVPAVHVLSRSGGRGRTTEQPRLVAGRHGPTAHL